MTLFDLKQEGVAHLRQLGNQNPDLDVELLLGHVFSMEREMVLAHTTDVASEDQISLFRDLLKRRAAEEPIAYIIGYKPFFGHDFIVTPDVLIPRPDSEVLVHALLDMEQERGEAKTVVEVGIGSGAISLSVARHLPACRFIGYEISEKALAVAQQNLDLSGVLNVEFHLGSYLDEFHDKADYIIANLPYIPHREMDLLPVTVRDFEPGLALEGGEDGLDPYRFLLSDIILKLRSGGWVFMEMHPEQIEACKIIAIQYLGTNLTFKVIEDLAGRNRVLGVQLP